MKRFKVLFASLAVASLIVTAFAFTNNSEKRVDIITVYFTAAHKYIGTGDVNSLVSTEVTAGSNWTETSQGYTLQSGNYLAALVFDQDQLTQQEAIDGAWAYYNGQSPKSLPADNATFPVTKNGNTYNVTVRRKTTN